MVSANTVVLGIDPASTHIAYVALRDDEFMIRMEKRLGASGPESCHKARLLTIEVIEDCKKQFKTEDIVAVYELPVLGRGGFRSTIVQCFTSGAVQGALYELGIKSYTANVSSWKKAVVGRGNADKGQVAESLRFRWLALYQAANGNQDGYDAACIALYGRQLLGQEVENPRVVPRANR